MKVRRIFGVVAIVVIVLLILRHTDGYSDYPTQVVNSEQPNDTYLDALLKASGYEGKQIDAPNINKQESTRITNTLQAAGYRPTPPTGDIVRLEHSEPPVQQSVDNQPVIYILLFGALLAGVGFVVLK